MITLNPIKNNMTELQIGGDYYLFSYKTLVACFVQGEGPYKTKAYYSKTTSRHVTAWLEVLGNDEYKDTVTPAQLHKYMFDSLRDVVNKG
jgi:hypothetical protein